MSEMQEDSFYMLAGIVFVIEIVLMIGIGAMLL